MPVHDRADVTDVSDVTEALQAGPESEPLRGFRVAVTSDRCSADLVDAFTRRGAEVVHAPAVHIVPVAQDSFLVEDTRAVIASRPEVVVVTTDYGFRRWVECAQVAGLGADLVAALRASRILVRGASVGAAVRSLGLVADGTAVDACTSSTVDLALAAGVTGRRVTVQLHGHEDVEQLDRLRAAGSRLYTVAPHRWVRPTVESQLGRLVAEVAAHEVDVVTFTSAPAVDGLVSAAAQLGLDGVVIDALRGPMTAAAVGPASAAPLLHLGVTPIVPERCRLGALVRTVTDHLTAHGVVDVQTALGPLTVHGRTVRFAGESVTLSRGPRVLLGALVSRPGAVITREGLLDALPEVEDEHALDMAVSRLRAALPDRRLVQTVVRRGYRLNV